MELSQALEQLSALQTKLYAYQCASSSLYLDSVTVATPRPWVCWRENSTR